MAIIKKIKNGNLYGGGDNANETVYPVTVTKAILDSDGNKLSEILERSVSMKVVYKDGTTETFDILKKNTNETQGRNN